MDKPNSKDVYAAVKESCTMIRDILLYAIGIGIIVYILICLMQLSFWFVILGYLVLFFVISFAVNLYFTY